MIVVKVGNNEYTISQHFEVSDGKDKEYLEYIIGAIMFDYDNEFDPYRYLYGHLGKFKAIKRISFSEPHSGDNSDTIYG